jgi:hypothetical protein
MRNWQLACLSVSAAALAAIICQPANAGTVVATIVGAYDNLVYDTPELQFTNSSGGTLINGQMVLTGYQGLNNGKTVTVATPDFADGVTSYLDWGSIPGADGSTSPGNLTAYDYDDEWGNTPSGYTNPACVVGASLCSDVGNFKVVYTATISGGAFNGKTVHTEFSPNQNFTGAFVGWQGLNQQGVSETVYDQHSGTFSGTMAVISLGTPEPATWAMMLLGIGGVGGAMRLSRAPRRLAKA